ncbi:MULTISPECIES: DUF2993 domain-containing protein [unclassified Streptomyces]|uniref:LmeA family phospholipid-binding protein n=1 Tax=Streptomyces sp. NPDC002962 TaxID=3364674 RepID=UPI002F9179A7
MTKRRRALIAATTAASLVAVLTGVDLFVERKVEDKIAELAKCRLGDASSVSAQLGDAFAGLKAVTGSIGTVQIDAGRVRREDLDMTVHASLYGVSADGGATSGTASATVSYAQLGKRLDGDAGTARLGSDGTHLTLTATVGDLGVPVTVLMDLSTTSQSVTMTPTTVSLLGRDMPISSVSALPGAAAMTDKLKPRTIDIDKLPAGTRLTGARPNADGLSLEFSLSPKDLTTADSGADGSAKGAASCPSENKEA